jgi:hypothetical protein
MYGAPKNACAERQSRYKRIRRLWIGAGFTGLGADAYNRLYIPCGSVLGSAYRRAGVMASQPFLRTYGIVAPRTHEGARAHVVVRANPT